jgi:hypothetical protein
VESPPDSPPLAVSRIGVRPHDISPCQMHWGLTPNLFECMLYI